jgi:hypothetical protein
MVAPYRHYHDYLEEVLVDEHGPRGELRSGRWLPQEEALIRNGIGAIDAAWLLRRSVCSVLAKQSRTRV